MPIPDRQVTVVQCIKIKKKDSSPEFTLKVTWSDNTTSERMRNYNNISDFLRILNIISPTLDLPVLKDAQKFLKYGFIPLRDGKKKSELDQFFQDLLSKLPHHVLTDERFIGFFEISSINELKLKYSKILESAQGTCRSKSESVNRLSNQSTTMDKAEYPDDNYSVLKLNPDENPVFQALETYQCPEQLLDSPISDSNYAQIGNGDDNDDGVMDKKKDTTMMKMKKKGGNYWVITNFKKIHNDEIDVEKGDLVTVLDKSQNGKWLVLNKDAKVRGWIPKEILLPDKEAILSETDDMEFVVVEPYKAVNSDEITVEKGELVRVISNPSTGWWKIRNGKSEGRIPGSCIGVLGPRQLQMIQEQKEDVYSYIQTSKNIEEMYSKVEKFKLEKTKATPKSPIERLPSYENLRELIQTKENCNRNSNIPSVYVRAGDVSEVAKIFDEVERSERDKCTRKLCRTESDSRQSFNQSKQSKDFNHPRNEAKQRNSSDAKFPQSSNRISFPSVYSNLKSNQENGWKKEDKNEEDVFYDNVGCVGDLVIEKCNKATMYAKSNTSSSNSQTSPEVISSPIASQIAANSKPNSPVTKGIKRGPNPKPNPDSKVPPNHKLPTSHVTSLPANTSQKPPVKSKPQTNPKPQIPSRPVDQIISPVKPKPMLPLKPKEKMPNRKEPAADDKKNAYPVNDISKETAEELLRLGIKGAFLFRVSNKKEKAAILSIYDGSRTRHINVERDEAGELTVGNSNFNSLPEIADYFKQNPIARNATGEELKLSKHLLVQ